MSAPLPALRRELNFLPSPQQDRPGLFISDPLGYSDSQLIIPPGLLAALECFDGERTEAELATLLQESTGQTDTATLQHHLRTQLSEAGFLRDETFAQLREQRHRDFAAAVERMPAHCPGAYKEDATALQAQLNEWMRGAATAAEGVFAIAAPHSSPEPNAACYRDAYAQLSPTLGNKTFLILATSHYGEPNRFGLTRKPFRTPLGLARTDAALVQELERSGGAAVIVEDYSHSIEHSVELEVIWLQHLYGPDVSILPILIGPFVDSIYGDHELPEENADIAQFLQALRHLIQREPGRFVPILSIDLAHMGQRYGDRFLARPLQGVMNDVKHRDMERLEAVCAGRREEFWAMVRDQMDDLKWCGSCPLYTFLSLYPQVQGFLDHYHHWDIDPASVVSMAALRFHQK
jgi:MEMO1 family protein